MAFAGQRDDPRARANGELDREHANAAARPGDDDRLTRRRSHRAHGRDPRRARDEQRARHLPRDIPGLCRQVARFDEHVLGMACAVVAKADHLIADGYAADGGADLLDHASEV